MASPNSRSQPVMIVHDDSDFGDSLRSPSNASTGGTPLRRSATPILVSPPGSRDPTPIASSFEDLTHRPRSNPRTRTPMRYESPLNPNHFRDASPSRQGEQRREGQRVTVRPMAGAAVGAASILARRIVEERHTGATTVPVTRSSKQGPSHRKVRRWNNDGFVGLASELAKSNSSRGSAVAEAYLRAQADAPSYRSILSSQDGVPSTLSAFMQDESLGQIREQFFRGELGHGPPLQTRVSQKDDVDSMTLTPAMMLTRVPERLRNVVVRACSSSAETARLIDWFEACLERCWRKGKPKKLDHTSVLLQPPTVAQRDVLGGSDDCIMTTARFYFDAESSTGGFHRLLLHAVCQFHGLHATSTMTTLEGRSARLLTASGKSFICPEVKLTEYSLL